ncbi:alpha/beta hydrolase fold protein [Gloeothece citriformis PCC 7424]|uniref:Alpha/beta hydrolase fold protein n=1 Tax=Gloeothece citriformis (strain PCC 7424) TaxID=65393 RepID=B7KDZ2_GLOC7|nr:alpha/beta fold hydrolase [Gloeothece citriformis]ACK71690.1 alpha/beta hydrolase fold protein [Gloeothece citriformis PCC 7424]
MERMIAQPCVTVAGSQMTLTTEYLTAGEGSPLLLLHGVGDSAYSWQWVIPALARTHRIYAPSLPGFGASDKPKIEYSPEFFTAFVKAFLDTLDIQQASVVGNSLGGLVSIRLALSSPSRVNALVLVDSAGLGRTLNVAMRGLTLPGTAKILGSFGRTSVGAKIWSWSFSALTLANPTRAKRDWLDRIYNMAKDPAYLEATVSALKNENTIAGQRDHEIMLDQLSKLNIPTLVIWGQNDRVLPVNHAHTAISRLPQGQLKILSDCGHIPQIEQPEAFEAALSSFLNEVVDKATTAPS